MTVVRTQVSGWTMDVSRTSEPGGFRDPEADLEADAAQMAELFPLDPYHDTWLRVAVSTPGEDVPSLVVRLSYHEIGEFGANALLIPETDRVFVGGGTRLICYWRTDGRWSRQWEREVQLEFTTLAKHGEMVVLSAEVELAAWTLHGVQRWSRWVAPPWTYDVEGGLVHVDEDGRKSVFDLHTGRNIVTARGGAARRLITRVGGILRRE